MYTLPKPILGEITAFTIATPDLEASLAFYQRLGYSELFRADWPFPWIQVSDGVVLIMLRKDPKPYIALTYYVKKIDAVVKDLEKKGIQFREKPKPKDMVKRYLMTSPDGLNITLVNIIDGFSQPKGPGMLQMPQEDYMKPEKYVNKVCGLYSEFAHPVADLEKSLAFWELLGFTAISRFTSPYPWAIISDGLSIAGLHQSSHFSGPAITYFAADMADKIISLKQHGLTNYHEDGPGIVVTTPEKQQIFLYQLGMVAHDKNKAPHTLHQVIIETPRLFLKELSPEIMKEIFTYFSDKEAMLHLGLSSAEELETKRDNFQKGMTTYRTSFKTFVMVEKETGKAIGTCGFHNWFSQHSRSEMGYRITDDSTLRKGFMTEAVKALVKYGFEEMKLNRIEAFTGSGNTASIRILKGLGFVEEGTLRSHYCNNGKMEDSICFAMLHSEYVPN